MADRVQRPAAQHPRDAPTAPGDAAFLARARTAERFVLRHRARAPLEWDLRLESPDGAADWWLPRGLPWAPDDAREATPEPVGDAPAGDKWDAGRARASLASDDQIVLDLEGRRVRGRYALRRREDARAWSVERLDAATVRPLPTRVLPMLARAAPYPRDAENYAFEIKWDGIRAVAYVADRRVTLRSRNMNSLTDQYPELQELGRALAGHEAVLDGEIVAFDDAGRPSFQRLQGRMGVTSKAAAQQKSQDNPVVLVLFDVLYLDGHDTTGLPYEERRAVLESLQLSTRHVQVPPAVVGDGRALLATPGAEGIVAKRLGSTYEPGARSATWLKVKEQARQELVIGGFTAGRGARQGRVGALLVGYYDDDGRFRYGGNVGTGFSDRTLDELEARLRPMVRATSPFADATPKGATFVEPTLVGEFEFMEWTAEGRLRHPSFKGLRFDKDARDVRREEE